MTLTRCAVALAAAAMLSLAACGGGGGGKPAHVATQDEAPAEAERQAEAAAKAGTRERTMPNPEALDPLPAFRSVEFPDADSGRSFVYSREIPARPAVAITSSVAGPPGDLIPMMRRAAHLWVRRIDEADSWIQVEIEGRRLLWCGRIESLRLQRP